MNGKLPIALVGIDFRRASSRTRSRLVLSEEEHLELARHLEEGGWARGLASLDTCNRNEWIVCSDRARFAADLVHSFVRARLDPDERERAVPYVHVGEDAARHFFSVAIGQESLVQGERQIASQIFTALERARRRGTSCRVLNGLGNIAGRLVQNAIRDGAVGSTARGVHSLAIDALRHHLGRRGPHQVAVVGLGSIGRKVVHILDVDPAFTPVRFNRTVACACGTVLPLGDLPAALGEVDGVVVCTAAAVPLLHPHHLPPRSRPLLVVDIGIPEQVSREPSEAWTVLGLDELTAFHQGRTQDEDDPGEVAERLIQDAVDDFVGFCHKPVYAQILSVVQQRHRQIAHHHVPELMEGIPCVDRESRVRFERELRTLLAQYTNDVLRTIEEASKQPRQET